MTLPEFFVGGIPLIFVIFALVEEIKAYGLTGKILRLVSLLLGLLFAFAFQVATAMPVTLLDWLTVVVVGLLYGLAASGGYDFLDSRFPFRQPDS